MQDGIVILKELLRLIKTDSDFRLDFYGRDLVVRDDFGGNGHYFRCGNLYVGIVNTSIWVIDIFGPHFGNFLSECVLLTQVDFGINVANPECFEKTIEFVKRSIMSNE
jgi:hypothetical protein